MNRAEVGAPRPISIELSIGDWGIEGPEDHMCGWTGADMIVASGHTFEEALENAEIFFMDQDGGEAFSTSFDGSYMSNATYEALESELAAAWAREVDRELSRSKIGPV